MRASPVAPALNDHQARGHHDERNQRGQDHDQHKDHGHLPSQDERMVTGRIEQAQAPIRSRRCDLCPGVARFRTRHGLRFRPRAAVSALASGRCGPTRVRAHTTPTLGDAPAAPALIAWGKGILLLTLADHEMARRYLARPPRCGICTASIPIMHNGD